MSCLRVKGYKIIGLRRGHGGVLPGAKVTAKIAAARGVPVGVYYVSPTQHSAFTTPPWDAIVTR